MRMRVCASARCGARRAAYRRPSSHRETSTTYGCLWRPARASSPPARTRRRQVVGDVPRKYRTEMKAPEPSRLLDLLAALSRQSDFAVGCYCEDEARYRSVLRSCSPSAAQACVSPDLYARRQASTAHRRSLSAAAMAIDQLQTPGLLCRTLPIDRQRIANDRALDLPAHGGRKEGGDVIDSRHIVRGICAAAVIAVVAVPALAQGGKPKPGTLYPVTAEFRCPGTTFCMARTALLATGLSTPARRRLDVRRRRTARGEPRGVLHP